MKAFDMNEVENVFEIGRTIQALMDAEYIDDYDSKEAFMDAVVWSMEFENKYAVTDDYYNDIYEFVENKMKEKGMM